MKRAFVRGVVVPLLLLVPTLVNSQTAQEIEALFWWSGAGASERQGKRSLEPDLTGHAVAEAWACLGGHLGLDRAARGLVQQG